MSSLFPYKHHSGPEGLLRPPLVYSGGWLRACIRAAPQGWQLSEGSQGVLGTAPGVPGHQGAASQQGLGSCHVPSPAPGEGVQGLASLPAPRGPGQSWGSGWGWLVVSGPWAPRCLLISHYADLMGRGSPGVVRVRPCGLLMKLMNCGGR